MAREIKGIIEQIDTTRVSRAGDFFHWRWAARRCLKLLTNEIDEIRIEGSLESDHKGEYSIDVSEYRFDNNSEISFINYYQLKHSIKQLTQPFTLSGLKKTITDFASRYDDLSIRLKNNTNFFLITNRPVDINFKKNIQNLSADNINNPRFKTTIEQYTGLDDKTLQAFCKKLSFVDTEENYQGQKYTLQNELRNITVNKLDSSLVRDLITLVESKVEPASDGRITKIDVLKILGVSDESDLFPAPSSLEFPNNIIVRYQQQEIIETILGSQEPVIITASGGVGKSIFARQLFYQLQDINNSKVTFYDCYASGSYRRPSRPRHRLQDVVVQISNQLGEDDLCDMLVPQSTNPVEQVMRSFISRLADASERLKNINKDALLILLFDAVDNAEIRAQETNEKCFAHLLLQENFPSNCRIIFFARPERINLLDPPSSVREINLNSFSQNETYQYLHITFPAAREEEAKEFHYLTNGNPRVQANALSNDISDINQLLSNLGPGGQTVDSMINMQLDNALRALKNDLPNDSKVAHDIDLICTSIALLPPFIPTKILAAVSGTSENAIQSFISDFGHAIVLMNNGVQFRDEPTETWFRRNFSTEKEQIIDCINSLRSLSAESLYVSEVLPGLLWQAGEYEELIVLALSEDQLPENNETAKQSIRLSRLQFAFRAAISKKDYLSAGKLAFQSAELLATDGRRLKLLKYNIDLVNLFYTTEQIESIAYKKRIKGDWEGSENVYSAALLADIDSCKSDARRYLRTSQDWLNKYFENRKDESKPLSSNEKLSNNDILEMAYAILKLKGVGDVITFIFSWSPDAVIYRTTRKLTKRLIDIGKFDTIEKMLHIGINNPYFILAVTANLMLVGRVPNKKYLSRCLNKIIKAKRSGNEADIYQKSQCSLSTILSFLEACLLQKLPNNKIHMVLNYYYSEPTSAFIFRDYYGNRGSERNNFFRAIALRTALKRSFDNLTVDNAMPKAFIKNDKTHSEKDDVEKCKVIIRALLPWYKLRAYILADDNIDIVLADSEAVEKTREVMKNRYESNDFLPFEVSYARFYNLILSKKMDENLLSQFALDIKERRMVFRPYNAIFALYVCCRQPSLYALAASLKEICHDAYESMEAHENVEAYTEELIVLSRATLTEHSSLYSESSAYFQQAVEALDKFGNELLQRWQAIVCVAQQYGKDALDEPELAYRLMRAAELVGNIEEEKHFRRNEAIETCFSLSPVSAFAIASRWRDREVGQPWNQLEALAIIAVEKNVILPSVGWSLTPFFQQDNLSEIIHLCIEKETNEYRRQYMFNDVIKVYRRNGIVGRPWEKIKEISNTFSLENPELNNYDILVQEINNADEHYPRSRSIVNNGNHNLSQLLGHIDFSDLGGAIEEAATLYESLDWPKNRDKFWQYIYAKIPNYRSAEFLMTLIEKKYLSFYDIADICRNIPEECIKNVSVKRVYPRFIKALAEYYANDIIALCHYRPEFERHISYLHLENSKAAFQTGFLSAFITGNLDSADSFYAFIVTCTDLLTAEQAKELLEYTLERFEQFIPDNYADGAWSKKLSPENDITKAISAYVWSSLGSPHSSIRWEAMHSVRKLYELNCSNEIKVLLDWICEASIGAFGYAHYPFYILHAKQHLLLALSRCANTNAALLSKYSDVFVEIALHSSKHLLIQRYAADIALAIYNVSPNCYNQSILKSLKTFSISPYPMKKMSYAQRRSQSLQQPVKSTMEIKKLYLGIDFQPYWLNPLARVFNISENEIADWLRHIILNEWKIEINGTHIGEPRQDMFNRSRYEFYELRHGYPRTDSYQFYLFYHAMFVIAVDLLKNKQVIIDDEHGALNEWNEWLKYHVTNDEQFSWLSDKRQPIPLKIRDWQKLPKSETWQYEIAPVDFFDVMLVEKKGLTWLNVEGKWCHRIGNHSEDISIESMFVSQGKSFSLLCTILENPNLSYSAFRYFVNNNNSSVNMCSSFYLKEWIEFESPNENEVENRDPFAHGLTTMYTVNSSFFDQLSISLNKSDNYWYMGKEDNVACLCSQIWSEDEHEYGNEEYYNHGNRMQASLSFLLYLCDQLNSDLMIQVEIKRNRRFDNAGYQPPYRQIFILSKKGRIRTLRKSYKIRSEINQTL